MHTLTSLQPAGLCENRARCRGRRHHSWVAFSESLTEVRRPELTCEAQVEVAERGGLCPRHRRRRRHRRLPFRVMQPAVTLKACRSSNEI